MADIFDLSATASSNTSIDGIGCNTGMSPANVDNLFRSLAALIRNSFASALETFLNGSAPLPVANGGTGAATAPLALTALGGLGSAFRDLQVINKSAAFTFADSERACGINYFGAAAAATINPNATTSITTGATYVVRNNGTGALTVTRGSGVSLYKNGSASSADATLAIGGQATLIKWDTDVWTINGTGVS